MKKDAATQRLRRVIHQVNNLSAIIMTESELALLVGDDKNRVKALRKVVTTVEEMKQYLKHIQVEMQEQEA